MHNIGRRDMKLERSHEGTKRMLLLYLIGAGRILWLLVIAGARLERLAGKS